ncbi:MAG: hypothetical protein KF819_01695 [Labilithrix sp.]|nr:hypothetical protein [Labilithrix sp.]
MKRFLTVVMLAGAALSALGPASCTTKEPQQTTYFERSINPILTTSCVRTNTGAGCHVADAKGNALGNLDTASFAGVNKRRDLLLDYGPYGQPAFLVKNIDPFQVEVQTYDGKKVAITTDIKHAGGSILDPTGTAYQTLRRWIQNGATENNTGVRPANAERQPCNPFVPSRPEFDVTRDPPRGDFAAFRDRVNPVITGNGDSSTGCAAGNCHGTVANSLYFTCGATPEQLRWNYFAAEEYLAQTPEQSELLRRPLSPAQGGAYHEGGVIFSSPSDDSYRALDEWARSHGPLEVDITDPGFLFFSQKVQPLLVKKGCMMAQCHSASMFHDYRLRGGSGGSFSLSATRKNYELSLAQLSVESEDINASRMVRKNLYRPEVCGVAGCEKPAGILHRGGPLLEDFGDRAASPAACAAAMPPYDYDNGDLDKIPAYCVLEEWLRRERDVFKLAPLSAVVYVRRPLGSVMRSQDFDVYAPGSDLRRQPVSLAGGVVTAVGVERSLTAGCGLDPATADIRRPQVSWDGAKVAFAARSSASEPLAIYEMNADGSGCAKHPEINAGPPTQNGLLIHNFDPSYGPADGGLRIVFASTRGNLRPESYDYQGPQRTPADPSKPNANLYVSEPDPKTPGARRIRQLTYLLNMEREPSFMSDGRVIFTTEKRAPSFAQLALRRINLDGGDYHPLYAQRGSIGHPEATQVVELADKDFAAIFRTPSTPHGGGAIAVFNRSIGIDFRSPDAADYPVDPGVLDPTQLQSLDPAYFLRSLRSPDPASNARPGPTSGLYTSPSAIPDGLMLVSFGEAGDVAAFGGDYDVYVMDPITGAKTKLLGEAGSAEVDAVGIYARLPRPTFRSTLDEPNGHTTITDKPESEVHVLDMRVLSTLLFQNTPTGRLLDPDLRDITIYEDMPPPLEVDSFEKGGANVVTDAFGRVYVRRRVLGGVPIEPDGSTKFNLPGGLPIVIKLPDTPLSRERNLPRFQRESMMFAPGEYVHQSFKAEFFDALCGQCHGSISGKAIDTALNPDFVTRASATISRDKPPFVMAKPPNERGPIEGPPPGP